MKVKVTAQVWSAAISSHNTSDQLVSYLYDHTEITNAWRRSSRTYRALCTTVVAWVDPSRTGSHTAAVSEALRLASYQCERLQSGFHFAVVAGDLDDVLAVLKQQGLDDDATADGRYYSDGRSYVR